MIEDFQTYLETECDLSGATLKAYITDLRDFIKWYEVWNGRSFQPADIATPTITSYRDQLQERLKPASVNRRIITLKRYFSFLVARGSIERSPALPVKQVQEVAQPPRRITDKEESALMGAVQKYGNPRDNAILVTMLHTGIRAAELCDLVRSDVVIAPRSGKLIIRRGKGNKWREVPLNATARAALSDYLETLSMEADHLFPGADNGRLTERALGYIVAKYAHLAKLENISPHDLRHRFGYRMKETTKIEDLAKLMGHTSLNTTAIYGQATAEDLQRSVETIAWE